MLNFYLKMFKKQLILAIFWKKVGRPEEPLVLLTPKVNLEVKEKPSPVELSIKPLSPSASASQPNRNLNSQVNPNPRNEEDKEEISVANGEWRKMEIGKGSLLKHSLFHYILNCF